MKIPGPNLSSEDMAKLKKHLGDRNWRLNNLYQIMDEDGHQCQFRPNYVQNILNRKLHTKNVVLKGRQEGITTYFCLYELDVALFNSGIRANIIAHTKPDAGTFFRDKIQFAYERLPGVIKTLRPTKVDQAAEILIDHGKGKPRSGVKVTTSGRSGTVQYLHVSELGFIDYFYPKKAEEIKSGALNTVSPNCVVFIESTAKINSGLFYDICHEAMEIEQKGTRLTNMDYKFHFLPWFHIPRYSLSKEDTAEVVIPQRLTEYFKRIRMEEGIKLTSRQEAWYVKKEAEQGDDMKKEFPCFPDEAFEESLKGTYYHAQLQAARETGRIVKNLPYDPRFPVHTFWDIGVRDYMVVWFAQFIDGGIHLIDYLECADKGVADVIDMLREKKYRYGRHVAPHDIRQRSKWDAVSPLDAAAKRLNFNFEVVPSIRIMEGIDAVRGIFPICKFNAGKCELGLRRLGSYRKTWNQILGVWDDTPRKDEAAHAADAFRMMAVTYQPEFNGQREGGQYNPAVERYYQEQGDYVWG